MQISTGDEVLNPLALVLVQNQFWNGLKAVNPHPTSMQ
jgi:hypothetical protein